MRDSKMSGMLSCMSIRNHSAHCKSALFPEKHRSTHPTDATFRAFFFSRGYGFSSPGAELLLRLTKMLAMAAHPHEHQLFANVLSYATFNLPWQISDAMILMLEPRYARFQSSASNDQTADLSVLCTCTCRQRYIGLARA